MQGERKPPSSTVPLPPAKGVWPPSGQVKFSVPLSVVNMTIVFCVETGILELLHDRTDDIVELRHSSLGFDQPFSALRKPSILRRRGG